MCKYTFVLKNGRTESIYTVFCVATFDTLDLIMQNVLRLDSRRTLEYVCGSCGTLRQHHTKVMLGVTTPTNKVRVL